MGRAYRGLPPRKRPNFSQRAYKYNAPLRIDETQLRKRRGNRKWSFIIKRRVPPEVEGLPPTPDQLIRRRSLFWRWIDSQQLLPVGNGLIQFDPISFNPADFLFDWRLIDSWPLQWPWILLPVLLAGIPREEWGRVFEVVSWGTPLETWQFQPDEAYQPTVAVLTPAQQRAELANTENQPNTTFTVEQLERGDGYRPDGYPDPDISGPGPGPPRPRPRLPNPFALDLTPPTGVRPRPGGWNPFVPAGRTPLDLQGRRPEDLGSDVLLPPTVIAFPLPRYPTFVDPAGGSSDTTNLGLEQRCDSTQQATVLLSCPGETPAQFTTEDPPVWLVKRLVYEKHYWVRIFKRTYYNYGRDPKDPKTEVTGPLTEFVPTVYYCGSRRWTQTADLPLGLPTNVDGRSELEPKGWIAWTTPKLQAEYVALITKQPSENDYIDVYLCIGRNRQIFLKRFIEQRYEVVSPAAGPVILENPDQQVGHSYILNCSANGSTNRYGISFNGDYELDGGDFVEHTAENGTYITRNTSYLNITNGGSLSDLTCPAPPPFICTGPLDGLSGTPSTTFTDGSGTVEFTWPLCPPYSGWNGYFLNYSEGGLSGYGGYLVNEASLCTIANYRQGLGLPPEDWASFEGYCEAATIGNFQLAGIILSSVYFDYSATLDRYYPSGEGPFEYGDEIIPGHPDIYGWVPVGVFEGAFVTILDNERIEVVAYYQNDEAEAGLERELHRFTEQASGAFVETIETLGTGINWPYDDRTYPQAVNTNWRDIYRYHQPPSVRAVATLPAGGEGGDPTGPSFAFGSWDLATNRTISTYLETFYLTTGTTLSSEGRLLLTDFVTFENWEWDPSTYFQPVGEAETIEIAAYIDIDGLPENDYTVQIRSVAFNPRFNGIDSEGADTDTVLAAAVMIKDLLTNEEQTIYEEDSDSSGNLYLDCRTTSTTDSMELRAQLQECRTECYDSSTPYKATLFGSHSCYAPDAVRDATCSTDHQSQRARILCYSGDLTQQSRTEVKNFFEQIKTEFDGYREGSQSLEQIESARARVQAVLRSLGELEALKTAQSFKDLGVEAFKDYLKYDPSELFSSANNGQSVPINVLPPSEIAKEKDLSNGPQSEGTIEEKYFPYQYVCSCEDFSNLSWVDQGQGVRGWSRQDIPQLANGQRVCKHVLAVMEQRQEISETDIPQDVPADWLTTTESNGDNP